MSTGASGRSERVIDLNADIGEAASEPQRAVEAALIGLVSSVNIACGGHAGDEASMRWAVRLAAARGCRAGAHPSYPDRTGFGRTRMEIPARELTASVTEQIRTLASVAAESGVRLTHVKPHGALYHEASADEAVARAVFEAARDSGLSLRLVGAAGSRAVRWWGAWGAAVIEEGFMDRVYEPDGSLRSRSRAGALIESTEVAAAQAVSLACGGAVTASDGLAVSVAARTLCVHADTPGAVALARGVVEALSRAGVAVRAHDR